LRSPRITAVRSGNRSAFSVNTIARFNIEMVS
jgi:hypothetical protein